MALKALRMESDSDSNIQDNSALDEANARWVDCLSRVALKQDRGAFRELFQHYGPLVKSFAFKVPSLQEPETFR